MLAGVDRRTPCWEARLRDLAAAGHLRAAGPRGRRADARRHRLEARAARHPRAQGRAFDRVPAVGGRRRGAGRLSAARPAGEQPTGTCSSAPRRRCGRSGRPRSRACARHYLLGRGSTCPRPGLAHAAAHLRAAARRRRLRAEDDRRLRRAPLGEARPRSTPRSLSRRCARSPSATARRCWHDRRPRAPPSRDSSRTSGRSGRKYRQRGRRAAAAGPLRRRAWRQLTWTSSRPALLDDFLASRPRHAAAQLQPSARRRRLPPRLGRHPAAAGGLAAAGPPASGDRSSACRSCSTPPRPVGCSTPPPRCPTTRGRCAAARPITPSSPSATGWGCAPARHAACASPTSTSTAAAPGRARRQVRQEPPRPARPAHRRAARRQAERRRQPSRRDPTARCSPSTAGAACIPGTRQPDLPPPGRHPRPPGPRRRRAAAAALPAPFVRGRVSAALVSRRARPSAGCTSSPPSWATSTRPRPRST